MSNIKTTRIFREIENGIKSGKSIISMQGGSRCFAAGTLIRTNKGSIHVEELELGDMIMGMNGEFRPIKDIHVGKGELFLVSQKNGMSYVVNRKHILLFKELGREGFREMDIDDYNSLSTIERECLYGINIDGSLHAIRISNYGYDWFFGFEIEGSPLFLLNDGTIAHNSSKTYNTMIWLITKCVMKSNTTISIVRETLPALKRSVFMDFKVIMENMEIYEPKRYNKTEMVYRFRNGSYIEFFAASDSQKIRGSKRKILFVNEANELKYEAYQQLKMRTSELTILDYNPSFSDDHWLNDVNRDERTYHFITTYKDNPFLEQKIIEEIESLRNKNKTLWMVYGEGKQAVIEGLVFHNFSVLPMNDIPDMVKRKYVGIDFGFTNDPTAIVMVGIAGNDLYIKEICYKTGMLSKEIIQELKSWCAGMEIISESADPRLVQEIYNAGINIKPVKKFKGSIEAGIEKMQNYDNIFITQDSINVIKEFRNYTYQKDKNEKWLNQPIDMFNHTIDAIRYAILNKVLGRRGSRSSKLKGYRRRN